MNFEIFKRIFRMGAAIHVVIDVNTNSSRTCCCLTFLSVSVGNDVTQKVGGQFCFISQLSWPILQ